MIHLVWEGGSTVQYALDSQNVRGVGVSLIYEIKFREDDVCFLNFSVYSKKAVGCTVREQLLAKFYEKVYGTFLLQIESKTIIWRGLFSLGHKYVLI
jgi:hypothetical protein